jgi:hypothetical protein
MDKLTVEMIIDLRRESINANDRMDRRQQRYRTRLLREKSFYLHQVALRLFGWRGQRAHLTIYVQWPNTIKRDVANLSPTFKALVDGAIDAGVLDDDSDMFLVGPDPRTEPGESGVYASAKVRMEWKAIPDAR